MIKKGVSLLLLLCYNARGEAGRGTSLPKIPSRVGQFVSVVLEYPESMLERKDRRVGVAMVVIMVNDQGSVVFAVVLRGKRRGRGHHHQNCLQGCLRRV